MLERLVIHDVVLIEKLVLQPASGLNVFTGETGAGKSILLDALGLALGERSDANLIRTGASQASVAAEFNLPNEHKALEMCRDQGLSIENALILRRVIGRDGKSRAFVNDQPVSIAFLRSLGENLIEIHGQFETHGLLDPSTHRDLIDACAVAKPLLRQTSEAYHAWRTAEQRRRTALEEIDRSRNEEEFLRAALAELTEASPEPGEAASLAERRNRLQNRDKIITSCEAADTALSGDRGAVHTLAVAGKAISRLVDKEPGLTEVLAAIDRASNELAEAALLLSRYMATMDAEPGALDRIEERLFALRSLARKHNVPIDQLHELAESLSQKVGRLTHQGDEARALAQASADARHAYEAAALKLSVRRKQVAMQLQKAVERELPPLKLDNARFEIEIAPVPEERWSEAGYDRVTFQAATNKGTALGPLHKVASGGELSRFMLALRVVLASADPVPVLVFDEIDAGIGGATASAVGERLERLAEHVQILVVTHSPQVAARGAFHLRVAKQTKAKQTLTGVEALGVAERLEEIARMLAGSEVTDAARQAAQSLISGEMKERRNAPKKNAGLKKGA